MESQTLAPDWPQPASETPKKYFRVDVKDFLINMFYPRLPGEGLSILSEVHPALLLLLLVPQLRVPDRSGHRRTSTTSSRCQSALSGLNCERQISAGTAGLELRGQISVGAARLQLQGPGFSRRCRTSTASSKSQWALPGLNRELQISLDIAGLNRERQISAGIAGPQLGGPDVSGTARPQPRGPDFSGHCRTPTARARSQWQWALRDLNCECDMSDRMSDRMPDRMSERMTELISDRMPDRMSEYMSDRMSWWGSLEDFFL